jgi:hypothetical protein
MFRALNLLFNPEPTWLAVSQSKRGIWFMLLTGLLPLLLLSSVAEGYSLIRWGSEAALEKYHITVSSGLAWRFEAVQVIVDILMVFSAAQLTRAMCTSFGMYPTYSMCLTLAVYGLSPVFLARFVHCLPMVNIWVAWALGAFGTIYALYQGTGIVLQPEPTKGMGLYIILAVLYGLLTGMAHLLSLLVLQGKITF